MQEIRTRGIKMIISDTGILSEIMKNQLKKWMWEWYYTMTYRKHPTKIIWPT